jgi:hypothetical protein
LFIIRGFRKEAGLLIWAGRFPLAHSHDICPPEAIGRHTAIGSGFCMGIAEDFTKLEQMLADLVLRYEQYFTGLEKREPLSLRAEVEKAVRRYTGVPINNTMLKHKFTTLVGRFNTYREHWNRILRLMEEGRYSRDRFISDLRERRRVAAPPAKAETARPESDNEIERVYREYCQARKSCNLPVDTVSRDHIRAAIEKNKPALKGKLGTDDLTFRVVVEDGKPKIKAGLRK